MKWVTRRNARVNRIATAWLVRRFVDPRPEFLFVEADQVAEVQDVPEAAGLRAISRGFPLVARDDHEAIEKAAFLYDALYAALQRGGSA